MARSCYPNSERKTQASLASFSFSATIMGPENSKKKGTDRKFGGICMAYDKRYVAQKRQRRRRKTAKAKMHLYEQGKLPHDKLPALAKKFLRRKTRALKRAS
jgi:hypothetical protein